GRVGPEAGDDAALASSIRIVLEELAGRGAHGVLGLGAHGGDLVFGDVAQLLHLARNAAEGVARPPLSLLLLAAIAEGTAGVGTVLVEEAVDLRLDHRRALSRAHDLLRLLSREVDGERIHAVDAPGGDAEAEGACRESRLRGRLA